jgi:hypothetical protein
VPIFERDGYRVASHKGQGGHGDPDLMWDFPPRDQRRLCFICNGRTEESPDEDYAEVEVMGPRQVWLSQLGAHVACLHRIAANPSDLARQRRPQRDG